MPSPAFLRTRRTIARAKEDRLCRVQGVSMQMHPPPPRAERLSQGSRTLFPISSRQAHESRSIRSPSVRRAWCERSSQDEHIEHPAPFSREGELLTSPPPSSSTRSPASGCGECVSAPARARCASRLTRVRCRFPGPRGPIQSLPPTKPRGRRRCLGSTSRPWRVASYETMLRRSYCMRRSSRARRLPRAPSSRSMAGGHRCSPLRDIRSALAISGPALACSPSSGDAPRRAWRAPFPGAPTIPMGLRLFEAASVAGGRRGGALGLRCPRSR
ncbi:hypothetical protein C8Q77DRAFT_869393 [Trametes polyzona]|nr:hypothetical protein C8Q77DRAFT_869393 [Trametes polyzona]